MRVVVGIPALNEEQSIAKVIVRTKKHANKILVVDDGSKDDTAPIAESLGAAVLKHKKNLGKGSAIRDCFKWAKRIGADVLVTMDGDGQHDPSYIPLLVAALRTNHADLVLGSRKSRPPNMPRYRWFGKRGLDLATQVKVGARIVDAETGFRAYSRKAIENLLATEYGMGADAELLMRADREGMRIIEVPVKVEYGGTRKSSRSPVLHALEVFFSIVKFISIRHPMLSGM